MVQATIQILSFIALIPIIVNVLTSSFVTPQHLDFGLYTVLPPRFWFSWCYYTISILLGPLL